MWRVICSSQKEQATYRLQDLSISLQIEQAGPSFAFALIVVPDEVLLCITGDLSWSSGRYIVFGDPTPVALQLAVKSVFSSTFEFAAGNSDAKAILLKLPHLSQLVQASEK